MSLFSVPAMDITLARGPVVAASRGIAVEQNHQPCGSPSSSGRRFHLHLFLLSSDGDSSEESEVVVFLTNGFSSGAISGLDGEASE